MPRFSVIFFLLFLFFGCDNKSNIDPKKMHWDRDMCIRCKMVLSDRKFSAQAINPKTRQKYTFDDIGCVILWFKEDRIEWADEAIIWVNDAISGEWIDARTAFYDTENITPMAYGFGAHKTKEQIKPNQEIIDFLEVQKRVIKIGK
ncbi:MAG: hypothetical protein PHW07_03015 [Sulfurospirillaceae bacterium]|nr:hypothetical protein [Sulfurospirillaceae bacterium]